MWWTATTPCCYTDRSHAFTFKETPYGEHLDNEPVAAVWGGDCNA